MNEYMYSYEADGWEFTAFLDPTTATLVAWDTHPSFIGRESLRGFNWCVILFGVFDAALAVQDGLPAVSPNTLTAWKEVFVESLNRVFDGIDTIYAVRDSTPSEWDAEDKFLAKIEKTIVVKEFPIGKDYGEYRRVKTVEDFYEDVLGFSFI